MGAIPDQLKVEAARLCSLGRSSDDPYWSYVSGDTGETWIVPFVSPFGEGDAWQIKLLRAERLFCSRVEAPLFNNASY